MISHHFVHGLAALTVHTIGRRRFGLERSVRMMRQVGTFLRPLDVAEAVEMLGHLRGGSCLTRSLAIIARFPEGELVVGVRGGSTAHFSAHAWVTYRGIPIRMTDPDGSVIATFA